MHSDLVQREKERVGLYRQKTKAALIIQLAWRRSGTHHQRHEGTSGFVCNITVLVLHVCRYARLKRQRRAIEAQSQALQVC